MTILLDTHTFLWAITDDPKLPSAHREYVFRQMEKNRVRSLTIQPPHLAELESLSPLHRDPFDRMLVAQARAEKIPILSTDAMLKNYGVALW